MLYAANGKVHWPVTGTAMMIEAREVSKDERGELGRTQLWRAQEIVTTSMRRRDNSSSADGNARKQVSNAERGVRTDLIGEVNTMTLNMLYV